MSVLVSTIDHVPGRTRARRSPAFAHASESELVDLLVRRMRTDYPVRAIGLEVKSHGRCRTDIGVLVRDIHGPRGSDLLLGVEAKLTDWTRALRQAILNQYAVDGSLIAMPLERISDRVVDAAKKYGVGVLAIKGEHLTVVVPAVLGSPDYVLHRRMTLQLDDVKARGQSRVSDIARERLP